MSDTNGLSREQVEALAMAAHPLSSPGIWGWDEMSDDYRDRVRQQVIRTIAPAVAAMLAEARAEGTERRTSPGGSGA